jgi:hypothetical protein
MVDFTSKRRSLIMAFRSPRTRSGDPSESPRTEIAVVREAGIRQPDPVSSPPTRGAITADRLSLAAAALVVVVSYVHLCLYRHGYRFIPKIGVSFLLQAVSSAVLAVGLVTGSRRRHDGHRVWVPSQLTRLAAIGLSLGTLAALGIAHTHQGLFRFREMGLRPAPQTLITIVAESLAVVLLGAALLIARFARALPVAAAAGSPDRRARRVA